MPVKPSKQRLTKGDRAWHATRDMPVPSDSCDGTACTNPPAVEIAGLRLCNACLEKVRKSYPNSFARYWAGKIRELRADEA